MNINETNNLYDVQYKRLNAKNKNKNIMIIAIAVCLAVLIAALFWGTIIFKSFADKGVEDTSTTATETTTIDITEEPIINGGYEPFFPKFKGTKANGIYVVDGKSYTCSDGSVCYAPDIRIDSEYVNGFEDSLEEILANEDFYDDNGNLMFDIEYQSYYIDNVLSITVMLNGPHDIDIFASHNIDVVTGEKISDADLIEWLGISEDVFAERLIVLQQQQIDTNLKTAGFGTFENPELPAGDEESYIKHSSIEHLRKAQLYVDDRGYLHIVNQIPVGVYSYTILCDIVYT